MRPILLLAALPLAAHAAPPVVTPGTPGNVLTIQPLGTSGTQALVQGMHIGFVQCSGTIAALTVALPPNPQGNDIARVISTCGITSLTITDAAGNAIQSAMTLPAYTHAAFAFWGGSWVLIIQPQAPLTAAQVDAALGFVPYATSNPSGFQTAAQVSSAISAQAYPLTANPAGYWTSCPAATATAAGCATAPLGTGHKVTASASLGAVSVLGAGFLQSVSVTVSGVALGDVVGASFANAPPSGLTISAAVVTAANTVLVTPAATGALTLASGSYPLNFVWWH